MIVYIVAAALWLIIGAICGFAACASSSENAHPGLTCEQAQELIDEGRTP